MTIYYSMVTKRNTLKQKKFFFIIGIFIIGIIISLVFVSQSTLQQITSTEGYIKMQISQITVGKDTSAITLKNECNELTFFVSNQQAESIQTGLSEQVTFRPTTHDIFVSVLERYDIEPVIMKITKVEQDTYFAELTFKKGFEYLTIDVRPSDGLAIAVRTDMPIYANENLTKNVC